MEAFEFFIPQNIMVGAGTMAKLPECAKKLYLQRKMEKI